MSSPSKRWVLAALFLLPASLAGADTPLETSPVAARDFAMACTPSAMTIAEGGRATGSCTFTSQGGFSGHVSMTCHGLPPQGFCSFPQNPVQVPAGGQARLNYTLHVFYGTVHTTYDAEVRGTSGSLVHNAPLALTVPWSGARVTCAPGELTVRSGSNARTTCTLASAGGYGGSVWLSCDRMPGGTSCAFEPSSVRVPAGGSATTNLTVSSYFGHGIREVFRVLSQTGFTSNNTHVGLTIPPQGLALSCAPERITAPRTGSATADCTLESIGGYTGSASMSCERMSAGSCQFSPGSVPIPADGRATTRLTLTPYSWSAQGERAFDVRAYAGSFSPSTPMTLVVT